MAQTRVRWLIATVGGVLLVFAGASVATGKAPSFSLPLADKDTMDARDTEGVQLADAMAIASNVTLSLDGIVRDDAQTVLSIHVAGGETLGDAVVFGPTFLTNDRGVAVALSQSAGDPNDYRTVRLAFPAITGDNLTLEVSRIELYQRVSRGNPGAINDEFKAVDGPWVVSFAAPVGVATGVSGSIEGSETVTIMPGIDVTVTEVLTTPSGVVVRGRISGLSESELQAITLRPTLTGATSGQEVRFLNGRSGFGEKADQFEFRFPLVDPGPFTLSLSIQLSDEAAAASGIAQDEIARLRAAGLAAWRVSVR